MRKLLNMTTTMRIFHALRFTKKECYHLSWVSWPCALSWKKRCTHTWSLCNPSLLQSTTPSYIRSSYLSTVEEIASCADIQIWERSKLRTLEAENTWSWERSKLTTLEAEIARSWEHSKLRTLKAENAQSWERLKLRMLEDIWMPA